MDRTPIALITGSLGSGKTTLLRRFVEAPDRRIAVLMNEFGEISIDSRIIRGRDIDIVELAGGCVCCSLTGEFEAAVQEIIQKAGPDLIVVEATGVAESDALVLEVEDRLQNVRLDAVICIVDAYSAVKYPQVGYAARTQLASADILLINKLDLVTPEQLDSVLSQVRRFNETAAIVRAIRCEAPLPMLFSSPVGTRSAPRVESPQEHFESFAVTSARSFSRERFEDFAGSLPGSVFRAKGFVRFHEGTFLFNYVAGRTAFEPFPADATEVVFIGGSVEADRDAIESRFRQCED
jgi:G3E family GTPase